MTKKNLGLLFGGKSAEHEISIRSARNIYAAIDTTKYEVSLIGISPTGKWMHLPDASISRENPFEAGGKPLALVPGSDHPIIYVEDSAQFPQLDVVFPITHGPNGEDGSLQGILRQLELPFVGPDVLGSAAAMDKDVCKRLLREAGQLIAEYLCFHKYQQDSIDYTAVKNQLGSPLYIKPANMGSSVGVTRADTQAEFEAAIAEAFKYDYKVIVEETIVGRELECAVMGNAVPEATSIGEVVASDQFYDFEAKYISDTAAKVQIPAKIDEKTIAKLQYVARQAYQVIGCEGLTRVDMFLTEDNRIYVNELNTLPGFTSISMYPKLWDHAGLGYTELINRLLDFALEKAGWMKALKKTRK